MDGALQYENPDDYWRDTKASIVEYALLPPVDRHTIESVCESIFSAAATINTGWQDYDIWDSRLAIQALDTLWFQICWAGMTRGSAFEQQQIVHLVGVLKNMGTPQNSAGSALVISGEKLWTELPGLQTATIEMIQGLSQGSYTESPNPAEHWMNLHTLAARLSACGISDLRSCGVWALRYALEEEEDSWVPMVQRLAVVEIWLSSHGLWLESLAVYPKIARSYSLNEGTVQYKPPSSSLVPPGQLAVGAGIAVDGLSWERWEFWRSRLSTMLTDADKDGQPSNVSAKARTLLRYLAIE